MTKFYRLLAGLLLLAATASIVVSCSSGTHTHYANKEYSYSIDYPRSWVFEQINPNEVGIKPRDSQFNQIQISAEPGSPVIDLLEEAEGAALMESSLRYTFGLMGASNLNVLINTSTVGKWDWQLDFTFVYENTQLKGSMRIKETASISYTLTIIQRGAWPESSEVIDSFTLTR